MVKLRKKTVRYYRAWHGDSDRALLHDEIEHLLRMVEDTEQGTRLLDGGAHADMSGNAALIGRDRWFAVWKIQEEHPDFANAAGDRVDHRLPAGINPADTTHCVILDNAVVELVTNDRGPSHAGIARYLKYRSGTNVTFRAVIDPAVEVRLDDFAEVSAAQFAVEPADRTVPAGGAVDDEPDDLGVGGIFERAILVDESLSEVEVVFRWSREDRAGARSFAEKAVNIMGALRRQGAVTKAKVRGADGGGETLLPVDLMEHHIAAKAEVEIPSARRLTSDDALLAIHDARERIGGALQRGIEAMDARAEQRRLEREADDGFPPGAQTVDGILYAPGVTPAGQSGDRPELTSGTDGGREDGGGE